MHITSNTTCILPPVSCRGLQSRTPAPAHVAAGPPTATSLLLRLYSLSPLCCCMCSINGRGFNGRFPPVKTTHRTRCGCGSWHRPGLTRFFTSPNGRDRGIPDLNPQPGGIMWLNLHPEKKTLKPWRNLTITLPAGHMFGMLDNHLA